MRNRVTTALAVALLCTGVSMNLMGQGSTATILGTVTDTSGAAIPDASVQARNVGTGQMLNATADAQGRYRMPDLAVGDYEIQAAKPGFSTVVRKGVTLTVGGQVVADFSLGVGEQQQTVTVEGQTVQVETTNSSVATFTSQEQMRELPLNGRNFEQLIQLAPGVATVQWTTNSKQGRAAQYSVAGGRPEGQGILLDDESLQSITNNGMGSTTGSSLGVEAIGEFQTLTNTYGAQFGGNGAVINAVSKSGTNAFHGSAFDFFRNSALDARDFFYTKSTPPAYRRNQYGGSVGGPVKKDKAFFFVDYEGIRQLYEENKLATVPACTATSCIPTATNPTTVRAIENVLNIFPAPTTLIGGGEGQVTEYGNQIVHEDYFLGRFDYNLTEKDSFFMRYLSDLASQQEPFAGGGTNGGGALPFWVSSDKSHSEFSTIEERHIFTPSLINVARISFSRPTKSSHTPTEATVNDVNGAGAVHPLQGFCNTLLVAVLPTACQGQGLQDGMLTISGGYSVLGAASAQHYDFAQNRFTEADDMLWTHGPHSVRFGIGVSRMQTNTNNPIAENASWTFTSFANFLSGTASAVSGVIPGPTATAVKGYRYTDIAPYIQDDWKISSKLTMNIGVRWQFETNPYAVGNNLNVITNFATSTGFSPVSNVFKSNPNWKDFDPRIGLAFDPFKDHKTSFRAGFGLFYDPISFQAYQAPLGTAPPWYSSTQNNATYPFAFQSITPLLPTQGNSWDWNLTNVPYMIQYNFNIQRELVAGTVLTLGYVGSHGVHLITGIERNPEIPTIDANGIYHFATSTTVINPRINPALGSFQTLEPITTSAYNSLQASVNRRMTRNLQAQASYTFSKCLDDGAFGISSYNGAGSPSGVMNPYNQAIDHGPCSYDINHVFRINGLYSLPFHGNRLIEGWQISGIISAYSGAPFNVNTGFDRAVSQASFNTPRPIYAPSNASLTVGGVTYPACNGDPSVGSLNLWFNPNCYQLEPVGTYGNTGRDSLRGPGFFDMDIALLKDTKINEQLRLQFRAEFFNILNHENFDLPANSVFSASGAINATAGRITDSNPGSTPRQIQFGLKLMF